MQSKDDAIAKGYLADIKATAQSRINLIGKYLSENPELPEYAIRTLNDRVREYGEQIDAVNKLKRPLYISFRITVDGVTVSV